MLSAFSVKKPYTVAVAVILVLMLGIISFMNMTTDLMPSIDLPYVVVMTTYPGATPEEVETSVTRPLEQSLATTTSIKNINSVSSENTSLIILEFEQDANMDSIVIDMNGKIDMLKSNFASGVGSPVIMKLNPDAMPIMLVSVDADGMDTKGVTQLTDDVVVPAFERLDGVASVSAQGLYEEQLKVSVDEDKLKALNERITKKIDEGLDEAKEKLDEAQQKLEDGKETLADESVSQMEKVEKAGIQLTDGKIQMSAAEIQLITGEAQLLQVRTQMQTSLDQLNVQLPELYKQREEIEKLLNGDLPTGAQSVSALQASVAQAMTPEEIISKLPPGWESYFPGGVEGLTPEQIVGMLPKEIIDAITGGGTDTPDIPDTPDTPDIPDIPNKKELEKALAALNENIAKLEQSKAELERSIAATDARLAEVAAGKAALEQSKAQLAAGESQLSTGKAQLQAGLTQASGELATADAVLKTKMDEFTAQSQAARGTSITAAITPAMVAQILTAQNFSMPAGYVSMDDMDYVVKVGDKVNSMEELETLPVFNTGVNDIDVITLGEIANIQMINNAAEMYAVINGNNGIILSMQKQSTYSTADVSDKLNKTIAQLMADNPGMHVTTLMDQGVYINIVVDNVLNNLLYGAILAVIVLLLFLRSIKPTIIIALSIPISVVFALVLMYFSGVTLNVISLAGLALGVGMLVDNSIVVIENIYRMRHEGASAREAAIQGARQVTGAIIASTLTTVCVFLPIVFTQGISRQLFSDMGLTIAYSLFASLLVALTLIPAMSSRMIGETREDKHQKFGKFLNGYGKVLGVALRFKPVVLIAVFLLFAWCMYSVFSMGVTFMPKIDSTQLTVNLKMPKEHNTFDETVAMSNEVLNKIMTVQDVETVGAMMGGGSMLGGAAMGVGGGSGDTGSVSMYVILKENKTITSEQAADEIRGLTDGLDCDISVSSSTMDITALSGEGIQVEVRGRDLDIMQGIARDMAQMLRETEGTIDVSDGMEETLPEIRIIVKKEEAMKNGLTVAQIYNAVRGLVAEDTSATKIEMDNAEYPVVVVDGAESNIKMTDIRQLVIPTDVNGKKGEVKLYRVAKIEEAESLASIRRENQVRFITVSAGVDSSHNVGLVSRDFQSKMSGYELPEGYSVDVKGENQTIMDSLRDLIYMLLLALALIYLIMVAQFQSLKSPFIVMFTIPLAFTGGLLALMVARMDLSVISMLGFLILAGIVVNNGIVFVDYINQLRAGGMPKREAIIEAGKTRLRPIMMTALTTILGLTTLALGVGQGADMLQPMAVVTIGGLTYATVLTLFVVPCLYDALHRKDKQDAPKEKKRRKLSSAKAPEIETGGDEK